MGCYSTSNWQIMRWIDRVKISFRLRFLEGDAIDFDDIFLTHEDGHYPIDFSEHTRNGKRVEDSSTEEDEILMLVVEDEIDTALMKIYQQHLNETEWVTEKEQVLVVSLN
ncbi:hypothetical protein ACFLU3_02005 [Chloroflexota bacterium]